MPSIYITSSKGPQFEVFNPDTEGITPALAQQAKHIGRLFSSLIEQLTCDDELYGNERLQHAFAAGCEGCSVEEWKGLTEEEKESRRAKYVEIFRDFEKVPSLVICIGNNLDAFGAMSPSTDHEYSGIHSRSSEWDERWETALDSTDFPWEWSWTHRHHRRFDGHPFIFLSGFFILWPVIWGMRLGEQEKSQHGALEGQGVSYTQQKALVDTFLECVLFHELIHYGRTQLYGTHSITPEKCVDDPRYTQVSQHGIRSGEAGRLGEKLAFGAPVNLYMSENFCSLFYVDDEGTTRQIDDCTRDLLFHRGNRYPPLVDQSTGRAFGRRLDIPDAVRSKARSHREGVDEGERVKNITGEAVSGLPLIHFVAAKKGKKRSILEDLLDPKKLAAAIGPIRCVRDG
ncbi:hypothetical protein V5O48_018337 [Marasmius crinis-equi]|uniref:Uncharacterized protein n=1 Tax=Marasmius crinis-equi TaxID=585013 RepID=A0ABR3ELG5_9AGAR